MAETAVARALFVTGLPLRGPETEGCDRLYFGQEFCHRRLPSPRALEKARAEAASAGLAFTLVTPRLDEEGLRRVTALLAGFAPADGDEVVANDVGLIEALSGRGGWEGRVVAGRLLTKQRRGAGWAGDLPAAGGAGRWLRGSALDSPRWVEWFVSRYGIRRFEIDNLLQGVEVGDLPEAVRLSVYHPFLVLTVTSLCPWSFDGRRWRAPDLCPMPCRDETLALEHHGGGRTVLMGGMAQFLRNGSTEIYSGPAVDRHVLQPRVPC